ncbi:MAG: hypothetical protein HYT31_02825 [Parcubacteria group bacterium]|nr:hypothetical protein [Parcubacteria group bacterium]
MDELIKQYKNNHDLVYHTWFVNSEERLKAFRSVRRGVIQVIDDIKNGHFPNDFKGSSLEFVLNCITEQKEVFEGAAHPFYWKPKLRIPDIYENQENKKYFGQFLENCLNTSNKETIISEIIKLNEKNIKGLGPAVGSILYFLHPTIIPPCNTAIVKGFNTLFREKIKLGSWKEYLKMREIIIQKNNEFLRHFSNDLGAFAGFLFEIGANNILVDKGASLSEKDREKILAQLHKRHSKVENEKHEDELHTEMQYQLLKIGHALGYDVIAAANDRSKTYRDNKFSFISLNKFPELDVNQDIFKTICLIDVVWFVKGTNIIVCAFEVEKSTSIYSGILRLADLSLSLPLHSSKLYIAIPDEREKDIKIQLSRPSVKEKGLDIRYILSSDLSGNCDAMCRFGNDHKIMEKIARK